MVSKQESRLVVVAAVRLAAPLSPTENNPYHGIPTLIDSGASESFLDITTAKTLNIPMFKLKHSKEISLADGSTPTSGTIEYWTALDVQIQKHVTTAVVYLIDCPKTNLILGHDWLSQTNPVIDWRNNTIISMENNTINPIAFPSKVHTYERRIHNRIRILPAKKFNTIRSRDPIYLVSLAPKHMPNEFTIPKDDSPIDEFTKLPVMYSQFKDVFTEKTKDQFPEHRDKFDLKIELMEGKDPKAGPIYRHTIHEDLALKEYLLKELATGLIRPSKSSCSSPVLFAPKKNGELRLCIDYRGLNDITIKNRYPLPLIDDVIGSLAGAKYFTSMDLRNGYHNLRIAHGYEWLTAFRTKYGLFEYTCVPFGLTNAPAAFQNFMDNIFSDLLYKGVVIYLDDIMIYTKTMDEHITLVNEILSRLRKNNLTANLKKCHFHQESVDFLGHVISSNGIQMDPKKVSAIMEWPVLKNVKDVQMFLGLANYYRTFIPNFSHRAMALTELLKKGIPFEWTSKCVKAFDDLKQAFQNEVMLAFPDVDKPFIVETDASGYALGGILSQATDKGDLRPIAFYSRKFNPAERNYEVYDQELLAIKECFSTWRQYLLGAKHKVQVYTDHRNLIWFSTTRQLNRRQVRWSLMFADFDFEIIHRPGISCKPDAISRKTDYQGEHDIQQNILLKPEVFKTKIQEQSTQLCAVTIIKPTAFKSFNSKAQLFSIQSTTTGTNILQNIRQGQQDDAMVIKIRNEPLSRPKEIDRPITCMNGLLYVGNRLYVPENCRLQVLQHNHDHPAMGHHGINNTILQLRKFYWWPNLTEYVTKYVQSCESCQRNKINRQAPAGLLNTLSIPEQPWSSISMDFVVDLPVSNGFTNILVVVCRLTKMAHFIPMVNITASNVAKTFLREVVRIHGIPQDIISDRDVAFTSQFWQTICSSMDITLNMATAHHKQTDGQSENAIQQLKQYLRHYVNYSQDNWCELLPLAEIAHNTRKNTSTKETPFKANYGFEPRILNQGVSLDTSPEATNYIKEIMKAHHTASNYLLHSQEKYKYYADKKRTKEPKYKIGDQVMLSTKNIMLKRPSKKLSEERIGPFTIIAKKNETSFQLKLPTNMRIHDTFHVSLLTPFYNNTISNRNVPPPMPVEIQGNTEYEVKEILDSRLYRRKLQYLVDWLGYGPEQRTWEPEEHVKHCAEKIKEFHMKYPHKPRTTKTSKRGVVSRK